MSDFWAVAGLALLPAGGNFAGGLLAEIRPPSARILSLALHAAAGILIAMVSIELTPRAVEALSGWTIAATFLGGAAVYILAQSLIEQEPNDSAANGKSGSVWMIYFAVATDLFSDGLLIGSGSAVSSQLGLVLALGQVMADIPEGFVVIANFRRRGASRSKRLLISASFVFPVMLAAIGAFFLLRQQSEEWKIGALMVTAGIFAVAAVEDLITEAHEESGRGRLSTFAFAIGFALFAIVSTVFAGDR